MSNANASGKSLILMASIAFLFIGVFVAIQAVTLLMNDMFARGVGTLIDVVFLSTVGILGIKYRENLKRARLLRNFGVVAMIWQLLLLLFPEFNVDDLMLLAAPIAFLIGAQWNTSAFNAISKAEIEAEASSLIQLGFSYLKNGEWGQAEESFEQTLKLSTNSQRAKAYIGKLCVELHLHHEEELLNYDSTISSYKNFQMAVQFADETYKAALDRYALSPAEWREKEIQRLSDLAEKIVQARATRSFAECQNLIAKLNELPDLQETTQLRREIGTAIVDAAKASWEFNCPICDTRQAWARTTCSMCGVEFVRSG